MNKVALGIIALLLVVGAAVFASRSVINRNLGQLGVRPRIQPLPSLPVAPRTTFSPLPQVRATATPFVPGVTTVLPTPSFRPLSSSVTLPATGL